jgi:hypothetical protein
MRSTSVPAALHQELPAPAVKGLVEMFAEAQEHATERFERRLAEETGKLRLDFAEMKTDLLKWWFLFWLGQVAVIGSMLGILLRPR